MAIYITGDTHGTKDLNKVIIWYNTNKHKLKSTDILIICGDVCTPTFYNIPQHKDPIHVFNRMHIQIAFIDGNHENFEKLNALPIEEWNGGKIHRISDNVVHLMRGQIFTIEGKKFLTIGGGTSIDRFFRVEGIDYFREEDIMQCDIDETLINLEKNNNEVDYILTHTIGREFIYKRMYREVTAREEFMGGINTFLDYVNDITKHEKWYFGHFHIDVDYLGDNKYALYNQIIKL